MRFLQYLFATIVIFSLASCLDVNEEIVINEDGSGQYNSKMDMGALVEMMQTFAGEEELSKKGLDKAMDTIIMLKDAIAADTAEKITPQQKALLQDGSLHLQMNMQEKLFKINMNLPYKSYNDLQLLMSGAGNSSAGMGSVFKNLFGDKNKNAEQQPDTQKDPELGDFSGFYDITIKNGLISRKVNEERFKEFSEKPEIAQMQQMSASGMEILYTTTIKLPRPAKDNSNPIVKLSDDKKTVTIRYNLLDLIQDPAKYSYTIEY